MAALTALAIAGGIAALGSAGYQISENERMKRDAAAAEKNAPPPPKPPNLTRSTALGQAAATAAGDDLRRRSSANPGRRSTLLTGAQGVQTLGAAPRKTLMGL